MNKVRPFYWSVRRELWENPALWVAPLAVEAVVLFGYFISSFHLPRAVANAAAGIKLAKGSSTLDTPFAVAAAAAMMISFFVAIFYALGALHNERRDRSLLFWKSLPVSDLTVVASKAVIPLVVQPAIIVVIVFATQLLMLFWATIVLALSGGDLGYYYSHTHLPMIWLMLPYGMVVNALWDAPFYGWLILVSAWARKAAFVWAIGPWLALMAFEWMGFQTFHVRDLLGSRLFGGFELAFTIDGKTTIQTLSQVTPLRWLGNPGLYVGLVVGLACFALCVRLRRRNDPI